jgi:Ca2+-binding EF-hand superfamily protein
MIRYLVPAAAVLVTAAVAGDAAAQRSERVFEVLDADDDGFVDRAELRQARGQRFGRMDRDGDGVVSAEEIEALRARARRLIEARLNAADADDDGAITRAEFDALEYRLIAKGDRDGDGRVSADEFRAFVQDRRGAR